MKINSLEHQLSGKKKVPSSLSSEFSKNLPKLKWVFFLPEGQAFVIVEALVNFHLFFSTYSTVKPV